MSNMTLDQRLNALDMRVEALTQRLDLTTHALNRVLGIIEQHAEVTDDLKRVVRENCHEIARLTDRVGGNT